MGETSLPANDKGVEQLEKKLENLAIRTVEGERSSPRAGDISGKVYLLDPNSLGVRKIGFNFEGEQAEIILSADQGDFTIRASYEAHVKGLLANAAGDSQKIAVSGAWKAEDTYGVKVIYFETPQSTVHTFRFKDNRVYWDTENRASFGPKHPSAIPGTYK
jgi:hypothetical protein